MAYCSLNPFSSGFLNFAQISSTRRHFIISTTTSTPPTKLLNKTSSNKIVVTISGKKNRNEFMFQCTTELGGNPKTLEEEDESEYETENEEESEYETASSENNNNNNGQAPAPLKRRRRRYRKQYPGEKKGITEEMRFVAMKLRNNNGSTKKEEDNNNSDDVEENNNENDTWQPSMDGFLKYLVDTQLVFTTVERIVDQSTDVSYVYFRKTGLERSKGISKDLEWLSEQGHVIPKPSNPGLTYVQYLEELAEKTPPLFLCHFYNIYFSHIAGGQVIAKQVSKKLLQGRELEFYKWDGDAQELMRGVREKLNALGEHWSRDEKTKCLRESTKAFRSLGQIVRLIIL